MKRTACLITAVSFAFVACSDAPTQPEIDSPLFEIVDAAHNNGNAHFFFLPPMVSNPVVSGTVDGSRAPVVRICELATTACATTQPTGFPIILTTTTGPDHYIANWNTSVGTLGKTYRIQVSVNGTELGHADVVLLSGGSMKNAKTQDVIPLKDGRTLPIKFRIECGALTSGAFLDNGDGTITDFCTGLMWEKKTTDGSVHDVGNTYTWGANGSVLDGTASTVFLATLNTTPCFAGHCDWRLPTLFKVPLFFLPLAGELKTILDVSKCGGTPTACIDPIFDPTATSRHWAANGDGGFGSALTMFFSSNSFTGFFTSTNLAFVRAVRTAP